VKPGWVRVNFNYFISESSFQYLLEAVHLVARLGHRLLADYTFEPKTGLWRHYTGRREPPMRLADVSYRAGKLEYRSAHSREPEAALERQLAEGRAILTQGATRTSLRPESTDFEALRWFPLPHEGTNEMVEVGGSI
jgi:hypothetical protein